MRNRRNDTVFIWNTMLTLFLGRSQYEHGMVVVRACYNRSRNVVRLYCNRINRGMVVVMT